MSGILLETCLLCLATPIFYRQSQGNFLIPPQTHHWRGSRGLQIHIPCHGLQFRSGRRRSRASRSNRWRA
uniref:Uncharacterized protein n=1 Tax=Arundo donax TaxID=35708 RepID=A0A0A9CW29_ARUDO